MILQNQVIEELFEKFRPQIGGDYHRYKNHVYRVFANCLLMDDDVGNQEKYAIATVFHDIGIWTDHTIDYIDPSIVQLELFLNENGKQPWIEEISLMIFWHHKITTYNGTHLKTVEIFRKADWIDVSLGLLTFGADRHQIKTNMKNIPNLGFHAFLVKQIFRNLLRHPFNPLPMFKK